MKCEEAAERITALLDGELPPAERREVEEHLASCARCREAREAEESVVARLHALPRPPLPAGFAAGVMEKVRTGGTPGETRPAGRILPMWPAFAAVGAVAAAIVAMVMVGPGRSGGSRDVAAVHRSVGAAGPPAASVPAPARALRSPDAANEAPALEAPATETALVAEEAPGAAKPPEAKAEERLGETAAAAKAGRDDSTVDRAEEKRRAGADDAKATPVALPDTGAGTPAPPVAGGEGGGGGGADAGALAAARQAPAGGKAKSPAAATKKLEPALPRTPLFFRVPDLRQGQDAVERVLYANKDLALARNPWGAASDFQATIYGRMRRDIERESTARKTVAPGLPEDRVLEIRVRTEDLPRLQALLVKAPPLRLGPDQPVEGTGEAIPAEIVVAAQKLQAAWDNSGLVAKGSGASGSGASAPPADKDGVDLDKEAEARSLGGREPGQPQEPPALSAEGLRQLEKAPRPPSPTGLAAAAGTTELWVEIHLLLVLPTARPPK